MPRPALAVWRDPILPLYVLLMLALLAFIVAPQLMGIEDFPLEGRSALLLPALVISIIYWRKRRWLWRLSRKVWSFRTLGMPLFDLHYDPALHSSMDFKRLAGEIDADLDEFERLFWFSRHRRCAIYVLANHKQISRVFGEKYRGGLALSFLNVAIVARSSSLREAIRHELVHLFACGWNGFSPPLLQEGLATWRQRTSEREKVHDEARPLLCNPCLRMAWLRRNEFFFAYHRHAAYVIAGSFTGFLIERFGWDKYGLLYRSATASNIGSRFEKLLGVSLEDAERQWRVFLGVDDGSQLTLLDIGRIPELSEFCGPLRILSMVLVLAFNDQATEVRFEPLSAKQFMQLKKRSRVAARARSGATKGDDGHELPLQRRGRKPLCRLWYKVGNKLDELVSPPFDTMTMAQHVIAAAGLNWQSKPLDLRTSRFKRFLARKRSWRRGGRLPIVLGSTAFDVEFVLEGPASTNWQQCTVVLRIPEVAGAREEASRVLSARQSQQQARLQACSG